MIRIHSIEVVEDQQGHNPQELTMRGMTILGQLPFDPARVAGPNECALVAPSSATCSHH